jgi:hypothetical protein
MIDSNANPFKPPHTAGDGAGLRAEIGLILGLIGNYCVFYGVFLVQRGRFTLPLPSLEYACTDCPESIVNPFCEENCPGSTDEIG